jgi:hypothetical protein
MACIPLIAACSFVGAPAFADEDCTTADLLAGQTLSVGHVEICPGDGTGSVTFNIDQGNHYCLTELHLAIGELGVKSPDIPQTKKGNPKPGHFPYAGHPACEKSYSFGDLDVQPLDHVAAHAVVQDLYGYYDAETAWAEGNRFTASTWAMNVIVPVPGDSPGTDPIDVDPAHCYQCTVLDCLLNPVLAVCPDDAGQVQDLCTTTVEDVPDPTNGRISRAITRGCAVSGRYGQTSTLPAGVGITPREIEDPVSCGEVESHVVDPNTTCTFVCDGEAKEGCNAPPDLHPQDAWLNPPLP